MVVEVVAIGVFVVWSVSYKKNVGKFVAGRTELSGLNPSVQAGFMQLLQEFVVPLRMHRTGSAWLSRTLSHNSKRNLLFVGRKEGTEQVLDVVVKRNKLLLW